jgi:hypothetical protein
MKGAVIYKGMWLCKGSVALELHQKGEWKKLDTHLKEVDQKYHSLHAIESTKEGKKQ